MTLSIIIPCYNVAAYIEQCFRSIEHQLIEGYEAIFIDDGATDNTGKLLDEFRNSSEKKEYIKIIHQTNQGLSGARNIGIDVAIGTYITFIDGDDFVSQNYFSILLTNIQDTDLCVVSYNRVFVNSLEPRKLGWQGFYKQTDWKRRLLGLLDNELTDPSQADSMVTAWGKLYRTSIIKEQNLQFVDTKIIGTEDLLFNLEYAEHINQVFILDKPLYQYRKDNVTSLTKTYKGDFVAKWQNKYKFIVDRISIVTSEEKQAFQNRLALSIIGLGLNEMANPNGGSAIRQNLKNIITKAQYNAALQQLDIQYFPLHWKLFFKAAQSGQVFVLYWLLKAITLILDRKNK